MKSSCKKERLNKTLQLVATLLTDIPEWFIAYGTLLGITRNNSCIDKDDDVDIICNIKTRSVIMDLFTQYGFKIQYPSDTVFQLYHKDYCLIDFYCCTVKNGTYKDKHENVIWKNCYPLQKKKWKDVVLYLPNNTVSKLSKRYGRTWRVPKQSKGTRKTHSLQVL